MPAQGQVKGSGGMVAAGEWVRFWRDPDLGDLELLTASYVTHRFSRHSHEGYALGVIECGVESFDYLGATHHAPARRIVVVHPGEVHTGHAGTEAGWRYRMLYPDPALILRAQAELTGSARIALPFFPDPVIRDPDLAVRLDSLHRRLEAGAPRLERESRLLWFLAELVSRHAGRRPEPLKAAGDWPAVARVRDYLETAPDLPVSLNSLAELAGLPAIRLLRQFRRRYGLPPHAYQVQQRVLRAKRLLSAGETIAEVAAAAGFSDQSHLTRQFKRIVGVTPGQYRDGGSKIVQA